ncbi:DUF2505 domain-containing protein [Demequina flava]|uniref:DUF2505 domain-containing protein n=1 Tax=Demequina flava TaxID=1095025 RepID=UPI0007808362|nr:DUF2505 domain-containing protein [Demequina flava]
MKFSHSHDFAASVTDVYAMFADEAFAARRADASGSTGSDVALSGSVTDGFTVSIRRVVPSSSIPQEFRNFVGSDLTVLYTEAWNAPSGEDRTGTFAVEITGAPGRAAGKLQLSPIADGSHLEIEGDVNVKIPMFGSMIERSLLRTVTESLDEELAAADQWLAAR